MLEQLPFQHVTTHLEVEQAMLDEKKQKKLKNLQATLIGIQAQLEQDDSKLKNALTLKLVLDDLAKLYESMLSETSADSVTATPFQGQPSLEAKQNLDKTKMWVPMVDAGSNEIIGASRQHDAAFYRVLHVEVERDGMTWDQLLSVANTIELLVTTKLSGLDGTIPPESVHKIDTAGFVLVPYYVDQGRTKMWVSAEKTVTGAGLSVPSASVGNLNQLRVTGLSAMFGAKLKQLMAIQQGVFNDISEMASPEKFLKEHQLFGPLATDDANRGDQEAVYVPVELNQEQVVKWLQRGGNGAFVPVDDLDLLRSSGLLLGHTKNAMDVMRAVESENLIAVTQFIQAALAW
jgi:hypothetical protein